MKGWRKIYIANEDDENFVGLLKCKMKINLISVSNENPVKIKSLNFTLNILYIHIGSDE
jgi:hypothetical protein